MLGQYREAGAVLERAAPDDPLTCEPGNPASRPSARLFRLTTSSAVRFWATGGPYPDLAGQFPPVVIRLYRGCPGDESSTIVACGETIAEDLAAGKYFVTVVHTSASEALAANPPTGAFAYRVAAHGDTTCPEDLAARRLDDWMGESVPKVRTLDDLDGDSRPDVAVDYRAASNRAATRVLLAADYPRCLRTVLDADVALKVDGAKAGGFRTLSTTAWEASPSGIIEDLWVVRRATYDAKLGRYVPGKRLGCSDGPSADARRIPCREPRRGP